LKSKRGVGLLMSWILPRPPSALLLGRRRRRRRRRFKFSLGPLFSLDPFSFQLNLSPPFSSSSFPVKEKQKEEAKQKANGQGFLSFFRSVYVESFHFSVTLSLTAICCVYGPPSNQLLRVPFVSK
jgi:hypothetical protein